MSRLSAILLITPWERTALQLLAGGNGMRDIAVALGLSEFDADLGLLGLFGKIGARSHQEAIDMASRRGLLPLDRVPPARGTLTKWRTLGAVQPMGEEDSGSFA